MESFLTSLLDCTFRCHLREIQKKIPKRYQWSLHFTSDIRAELSNPEVLLSGMVINYSLLLLHKQFPDAPGLEDTELGICKQLLKRNGVLFQIIHDVNHWLVFARVAECADEEVYLCNSLSSGYTSKNVVKQICQIKFFQG